MRHASTGGSNNRRQRNNRPARRGGGGGGGNQRSQVYDSNGPDVRIRGSAAQVAEKYEALSKDAFGAGDLILAESYLQHAEHYVRLITVYDERPAVSGNEAVIDTADGGDESEPVERFVKKSQPAPQRPVQDDLGLPSSILGISARDGVDA